MKHEIMKDGRLRIYCDPEEQRTIDPAVSDAFLYEGECLEDLIANSELDWIPEGITGDLTSAPMLGILGPHEPGGNGPFGAVFAGNWQDSSGITQGWYSPVLARWAFMSYQVRSYVDDLAENGECFWQGGYADGRLPS